MAFHKHDFHYDKQEHEQEVERLRHQQYIQKEWLDQQIAEKARLNQEGRRDGRIDHNEYELFEERRIARFKFNLIRRIIENWSSVTSFDWAEANQLAQEDAKFKEALEAAKADHERKEQSKIQRQEELQRKQVELLAKEKAPARHKFGSLEFDPSDPYSKLLNGMHSVQLPGAQAPATPPSQSGRGRDNYDVAEPKDSLLPSSMEPERPNLPKSVPFPPLKASKARQILQPSQFVEQQSNPMASSPSPTYPIQYQPVYAQQPPPVQILAPPQTQIQPSELKLLLELLQDQRQSVLHNSPDLQVENMFTNFQKKLDEIVTSTERNIENAVSEGVRRELEGKLSELRFLIDTIEQQRLESRQKSKRPNVAEQVLQNIDAETSMSPHRISPELRASPSLDPPLMDHIDQINLSNRSPSSYPRLSINDPVDYIVKSLQKRNANRMAAMLKKSPRHGPFGTPDASIEPHSPRMMAGSPRSNQPNIYANLLTVLDQLNSANIESSDSQSHSRDALLSATEFMAKVLRDLDLEQENPNTESQA